MNKKYEEIDSKLSIQEKKFEETDFKIKELENTQDLIGLLECEIKAVEQENKTLKEHVLLQESYSRKDNILFEGIEETSNEDTLSVLHSFLLNQLKIDKHESRI